MWLWCVFIHEVIWTATAMDTDRFHFFLSSRLRDESSPPPECGDQVNSLGCGSAEGEHKGLYARSEKLDLEQAISNGFGLPDQLIQSLFGKQAQCLY